MTTTPQTEAQRLAASISETLDSQDDSYLTCSVTKCLLQQAATELLRLDALRLELQTQLADYKDACTKPETRAVPASTGMHWPENEPVRLPASRAGRVYLAGPMTGLPELNFPAFTQEAERLRDEGLQVLNPADHGIVDGADWADYLRHDIAGLASCERIHLLRGWTKSKGACLEMTIAKALGMAVTYQVDAEMDHSNAPAVPQGLIPVGYLRSDEFDGHTFEPINGEWPFGELLFSLNPSTPAAKPAQEVGLTDEALDNLIEDLSEWSCHVVEDTAHQTLEAHVREVLAKNPIIAALRAKGQS